MNTKTLTVKTGVKAGALPLNRCEALAVKTGVKAGGWAMNLCASSREMLPLREAPGP